MKIRLNRTFKYQKSATEVVTLDKGEHNVTEHVGNLALRFGGAVRVDQKKAPENKVVKAAENKAGVGRKTKRRRRARAKPKS